MAMTLPRSVETGPKVVAVQPVGVRFKRRLPIATCLADIAVI